MKKTSRKMIVGITAIFFAVLSVLIQLNGITAQADTASKAVLDAKNGVMQILLEYLDDEGKPYLRGGGSGFLIGKSSSSGAEHIITNYHVVSPDDDEMALVKATEEKYSVKLHSEIKAVVRGDVTVSAQVVKSSKDADWVILKLDEAIYDRSILKLRKADAVTQTQEVYALGFPQAVTEWTDDKLNKGYYTPNDVTITTGQVSKLADSNSFKYIQHSSEISRGNSGGPLVDSTGAVIGVNTFGITVETTSYFYSLQIDEIIGIMDAFGIPYELADSSPQPTTAQQSTTTAAQTQTTTQEDTHEATTPVNPNPNSDPLNTTTIMIIAGVAVLVIAILVIVIVVVKKKSGGGDRQPVPTPPPSTQSFGSTGGAPVPPTPPTPPRTVSPADSGVGETSVLDNGGGETSVLSNAGQPSAVLVRVKTGETINIKKQKFLLGKERNRVDYCITNNNSISRTHANIIYRNGMYYLVDLNSTNCTYLNGKQLAPNQETKLNVNDKIKLADEEFIFRM